MRQGAKEISTECKFRGISFNSENTRCLERTVITSVAELLYSSHLTRR